MIQLYLIGFGQSLFFAFLILSKKVKKLSDYVLALYIFLLGSYLLFVYYYQSGLYIDFPAIGIIDIFYWTLLGPLLLIYVRLTSTGKNQLTKEHLFYLLPMIIVVIGFHNYFLEPELFFTEELPDNLLFQAAYYIWIYNSPIFYLISIWYIRRHSKRIKQYYSYSKNVDLKWLYYLANGFAVYLIFLLGSSFIREYVYPELPYSYTYSWIIMVIYIFGIGYFGYKQKGIFSDADESFNIERLGDRILAADNFAASSMSTNHKGIYEKSGLTKEEAEQLTEQLLVVMESDKPYLDSEINLSSLAKKMDTTTHKLSQVINEKLGKNFFDFINDYRVENAKNFLLNPKYKDYKIITLAFECGFNSKSTFYNVFKKFTSLTPLEYRQKHQ